jgi:two-component system, response regulator PdtaR
MLKGKRVMVVEDEALIAEAFVIMLEDMEMEVCGVAATADEAIALAAAHSPDVILMDVRLQGPKDGVDAAITIEQMVRSRVIFVTGSREPETLARIQQDDPAAVLFKPLRADQLRTTVMQVLK